MTRARFLARRLLKALLVVIAVVILNFFLIRLAPGDPAMVMAGETGAVDEQFVQRLREQFGLDRPLPEQLFYYAKGMLSLDLGFSYRQQRPVSALLFERLPATILLTMTAFAFALIVGVLLGVLAALRVGSWTDSVITTLAVAFYATPLFWVGVMAVLLFSVTLGWLPPFGMETVGSGLTGLAYAADVARHLAMPAVTLGLFYVAIYARLTRAAVLEVKDQDFVRTAVSKGLPPGRIIRAHVLRNALLPVITVAGMQAGHLIGGSLVIETVFAWPGIGRLAFDTMMQRDYNTLLGVFFIAAVMVVVFNIVTDLVYTLVDPRIETGR